MGGKSAGNSAARRTAAHVAETPRHYRSTPAPDAAAFPADAADLFQPARPLSLEERSVFTYGLSGKKNNEIAIILGKSKRTVETQMASALRKVGVEDREAAVVLYHRLREAQLEGEIRRLREANGALEARIRVLLKQIRRRA